MSLKILIVDDETELRSLFTVFLKREGYEVEEADNGKEAFEKIKAARPDLVLSDIRMPVWDGFQLLKEIATLPPPPPPILFMSGYIGREEIQVQKQPNVVGFMAKPIQKAELINTIRDVFQK